MIHENSLIREVSDKLEVDNKTIGYDLLKPKENIALITIGKRWNRKMHPAFVRHIYLVTRQYNFDSVQDLLSLMRNKLNRCTASSNSPGNVLELSF